VLQGGRDDEAHAGAGGEGADVNTARFKPDKGFTGADYGKGGNEGAVQVGTRAPAIGCVVRRVGLAVRGCLYISAPARAAFDGHVSILRQSAPQNRPYVPAIQCCTAPALPLFR
jgi:hypothetical protein